ncbi:hypothetical protein B0H17DRAFT_600067 [Mycena rosella]|uniref:DUF7779 domain-containing protein n=1 Tax=Mycena rosella TaxID=1033263 RepID=A0AAD7DGX7_MYCRO|nr:hypothetical protein B0H17DRAFT_600067 [Mycena rosella]
MPQPPPIPSPVPHSAAPSPAPPAPARPASETDWLPNLLVTAKLIAAGAEAVPFPFVKGAFAMVVTLLETVQKVKRNRDDLRDVCARALEIIQHVHSAMEFYGEAVAVRFKGLCGELVSLLKEIQQDLERMEKKRSGIRGRFREVFKADSTEAEITGYRDRIKELRANFTMVTVMDNNVGLTKLNEKLSALALQHTQSAMHGMGELLRECPAPSPIFHGRRNILDGMHAYFSQNIGRRHVSVLHGLGGAGKTQTALKFIDESRVSDRFSSVFFIDTSTLGTIDLGFKNLAAAKQAGSTTEDALQWLIAQRTEWLVLFNTADDPSIDLQQFLPRCAHGNILITTRNPQLRVHAPDSHYRLSDMEEADAVALLLRSSVQAVITENEQIARKIVQALNFFPLAVVQAGAFISKSGALERYLDLYKANSARLLSGRPAQTQDDYAWTVYTTWQMSFDCLSKPAARFLQLCSFLHHEGITEQIFSNAALYDSADREELDPTVEDLRDAREFLAQFLTSSGAWDELGFLEVTAEIQGYSLIERDPHKGTYSIHPLVHDWTQHSLADSAGTWDCIALIVGMSVPFGDEQEDRWFRLKLVPHVDSLLAHQKDMELKFPNTIGVICLQGRPAAAAELFSKYAAKAKQELGEDHPLTLGALALLAGAFTDLGRSQEAADLRTLVLDKTKQYFGEEHPDSLNAMATLAVSYRELGRLQEAAELEVVVLEKFRSLHGEEHSDTLTAMRNLAVSYRGLGRTKEAVEIEAVVLEKTKHMLGAEHPYTITAMGNLTLSYSALGQEQKAVDLQEIVVQKLKSLYGESHPDTLATMTNLAMSYRALGRLKEAAELQAVVLEKTKEFLGEHHPDHVSAMANLAGTYRGIGQIREAAELHGVIVEKRKQLHGEDHPLTLTAMANLASSYGDLGRSAEAAELGTVVLTKLEQLLGKEHLDTLTAMGNVALSFRELGRLIEAVELETIVLENRKKLLGEGHPQTLIAMGNLAASYRAMGKLQETAELHTVVLQKMELVHGEEHPLTLVATRNLAISFEEIGRSMEAIELGETAMKKMQQILGEEHPDTLIAMSNLAFSYHNLDRSREAAELEAFVLEKRKQHLGEAHPYTLMSIQHLATYRQASAKLDLPAEGRERDSDN